MDKKQIADKRNREKQVVELMIRIYCRGNHGGRSENSGKDPADSPGTGKKHGPERVELCPECRELAEYAAARVDHCPHMETKTFCSNCRTHCYKPQMREQIRQVMRYSGPRIILYHPIMAIRHVIEMKKEKKLQANTGDR